MKLPDMPTADDVFAEYLENPNLHRERERSTLAHAVALKVVAYRAERGLSRSDVGQTWDVAAAIARLEIGGHGPTSVTLSKLSRGLAVDFHIEITPNTVSLAAWCCPRAGRSLAGREGLVTASPA